MTNCFSLAAMNGAAFPIHPECDQKYRQRENSVRRLGNGHFARVTITTTTVDSDSKACEAIRKSTNENQKIKSASNNEDI